MVNPTLGALFGIVLSVIAFAPPCAAAERMWRLGFLDLSVQPSEPLAGNLKPFLEGLRDLGYVERRDFVIEARYANADVARVQRLVEELVAARVDIIVTVGTPTTVAAKRATTKIPIVMTGVTDPIGRGLIASLSRPGGNVTGFTHLPGPEFSHKGLQLLLEVVPQARRIGILTASATPDVLTAPLQSELTILVYKLNEIKDAEQFNALLDEVKRDACDVSFVYPEFVVNKFKTQLGQFLREHGLPAFVQNKELIADGALLYYYTDFGQLRRRAATYVDKIIKGANSSDLPVEQPSKFEFIVNLKTARALGLTIPRTVLIFADELIE
jgi:putative ABC transport system substrate-binding protein